MKDKRILILCNSSGGLYEFRGELVEALSRENKVLVSTPDSGKTQELAALGCDLAITPVDRRGVDPRKDLSLMREYRRLTRSFRPDLVLTYTIKPNVYGGMVCAAEKVPCIATVTGLGSAFQRRGMVRRVVELLYRRGLRKDACVFFQNAENLRLFKELGITAGKTRLVAGSGVNTAHFLPSPYPRDGACAVLFVGRIMKEKGVEELFAAAETIKRDPLLGPKARFLMAGASDEDYSERLEGLINEGIVEYLGYQTDMRPLYARCGVVVLPTYHEGMSNVLMEASASARPVIASDIPGCREIFVEGETGFGVRPASADSLTHALIRFISLSAAEREAMGLRARAHVEAHFDRRHVMAAYLEEMESAL